MSLQNTVLTGRGGVTRCTSIARGHVAHHRHPRGKGRSMVYGLCIIIPRGQGRGGARDAPRTVPRATAEELLPRGVQRARCPCYVVLHRARCRLAPGHAVPVLFCGALPPVTVLSWWPWGKATRQRKHPRGAWPARTARPCAPTVWLLQNTQQ